MAYPQFGDLVTTTIESRSGTIADNVSNSNAILAMLKKKGGIRTFSGGRTIREEISFATNSTANWYSGNEALNTSHTDVLDAAEYSIKQAAVAVVMTGLEEMQNSGKEAIIDLLDGRMEVAESSIKNLINLGVYSDGTGNGGKEITGFQAAVSISPTSGTYGGIDRAAYSVWRNKALKGAGTDYTGAMNSTAGDASSATVLFTRMWTSLVRGSDKPKLIVCDPTHFTKYINSLQLNQRFESEEMAGMGFTNVTFMGAPVVLDSTASGIAAGTTYFLNTDFLALRPHANRNFVPLKKRNSANQDSEVTFLAWAGNMTCRGAQFNGIIQD